MEHGKNTEEKRKRHGLMFLNTEETRKKNGNDTDEVSVFFPFVSVVIRVLLHGIEHGKSTKKERLPAVWQGNDTDEKIRVFLVS